MRGGLRLGEWRGMPVFPALVTRPARPSCPAEANVMGRAGRLAV